MNEDEKTGEENRGVPTLVDFADENSEYWNAAVDGRAFLMLVDRLGDRLGGGIEAMKQAARLLYEDFLDLKPEIMEPVPDWFVDWRQEAGIKALYSRVATGLGAIVQQIIKMNETSDCCWMDESSFYDFRVEDLRDLALEAIEKFMKVIGI